MEYRIEGDQFPVVICNLQKGESMLTEKGAMAWMTPNMDMKTQGTGGLGKSLGRMFTGDSVFQNLYTAKGGPGEIAFAASFPGEIKVIDIGQGDIIAQKGAFLASEPTVEISVFFRKKLGVGLFGGEGFITQRLSGSGMAFLEIDGALKEYDLEPGQQIVVQTGSLAYMSATCTMEIIRVKGVKNVLFGGEGLFNTIITGPGRVALQTMPISTVANAINYYLPHNNG